MIFKICSGLAVIWCLEGDFMLMICEDTMKKKNTKTNPGEANCDYIKAVLFQLRGLFFFYKKMTVWIMINYQMEMIKK